MRMKTITLSALALMAAVGVLAETANYHTVKSFSPKSGGTLKVEAAFQDIKVDVAPGTAVEVTVDLKITTVPQDPKEIIKAFEPTFEEAGDTILVRSKSKFGFTFGFSSSSGTITVRMPPGMDLNLHTGSGDVSVMGDLGGMDLTCETGSGDVKVDGAARDLHAETGSGNVAVALSTPARSADVHTGSGDVVFSGGAATFKGEAGSGDVTADGLTGSAKMDTGSGDIKASWEQLAAGATVKTGSGSGSVRLTFPGSAALGGVLDTGSGDIRSDFPGTSSDRGRHWAFAGGPGAGQVSVETGSGDIAVLKK